MPKSDHFRTTYSIEKMPIWREIKQRQSKYEEVFNSFVDEEISLRQLHDHQKYGLFLEKFTGSDEKWTDKVGKQLKKSILTEAIWLEVA